MMTTGQGRSRGRRVTPAADYRGLSEFRYQLRRFLVWSEGAARAAGVEPQQHQLLLAVRGLPAGARPTIATLAERLQVKHHTAVGLVDRLARKKLVERARSRADAREILVVLTPSGETLLRALSESHRQELEAVGPALVDSLGRVLDRAGQRAPRGVAS